MLQKSKSKSVAKFKFLIVIPLMMLMLTYVACSENSEEMNSEQSISEQLANIQKAIEDGKELNEEEVKQLAEIMATAKGYVPPSPPSPPSPPAAPDAEARSEFTDVPFAVIDEVPVFPGCEDAADEKTRKECMTSGIANFVNDNFNVKKMREFATEGMNRVIVQFKIDETGNVVNARARAKNPELEAEAIRVLKALPKMQPGKQKGKEVGVMYSLPIVFQVGE